MKSISKPSEENRNAMRREGNGHFCAARRSKVHDPREAFPGTYTAGRQKTGEIKKGHFQQLRFFCITAVLCFGSSLFFIPAVSAKGILKNAGREIVAVTDSVQRPIVIKGKVRDRKTAELIPFADVVVYVNDSAVAATTTNFDGEYVLRIDPVKCRMVNLKIAFIGYESWFQKEIPLLKNLVIDVELLPYEVDWKGEILINQEPLIHDTLR
jgi:hypothetical protein